MPLVEITKDYELVGPGRTSLGSFSEYSRAIQYRRSLEERIKQPVNIEGKEPPPRHYPPVLTKHDFVRRYSRGEFGNRAPTWETYREWSSDPRKGRSTFHIRNRVSGGNTYYDIPRDDVKHYWFDLIDRGYSASNLYISAMAPHELTLIQGEVIQTYRGLELLYTQEPYPMREALAISQHRVTGIIVVRLLRHYMCPNSWEWLQVLLDRYPGHVVEFSTFEREWGTLPGFNSVVWECRLY